MANKLAPPFQEACVELDRHFAKTHQVLTTRQLKAACGGSGSNETYLEYIVRWRAERIERTGVLSTVLSLHNQIESFTKTTALLLTTLSGQLRMCPIEIPNDEVVNSDLVESAFEDEHTASGHGAAKVRDKDAIQAADDHRVADIEQLAEAAAKASEARFLDEALLTAPERSLEAVPVERELPLDQDYPASPFEEDISFSRDDMGRRSAALPDGTNQSGTDEKETTYDRGAN